MNTKFRLISQREKCPNTEFFLVCIFPHPDWIRRDTEYLSVFSPNVGKYEPKKTPYLDTFHAVVVPMKHYKEQMGNKQLLESYIRKRSDTILSPRKYLQRHHSRHRGYAFSFKVQRLIFQFSKTFIFSLEHFLSDALAMRQTSFSDFL